LIYTLNDASPVFIHPVTGSVSTINLSFCSPGIFVDMQWKTLDDLCGSDHYLVMICYDVREMSSAVPS